MTGQPTPDKAGAAGGIPNTGGADPGRGYRSWLFESVALLAYLAFLVLAR